VVNHACADRQALGKVTSEGLFLEELERNPDKYLPEVTEDKLSAEVVKVGALPHMIRRRSLRKW